jgi:hypothetical protein
MCVVYNAKPFGSILGIRCGSRLLVPDIRYSVFRPKKASYVNFLLMSIRPQHTHIGTSLGTGSARSKFN